MRKIDVEIHKTFITANVRLSDPKLFEARGFKSVSDHDNRLLQLLGDLTPGSTLVVLGNLFSNSAKSDVVDQFLSSMRKADIQVMCVEGNQDHKYLWQLKKDRKIDLLGDMSLLESSTGKAVVSFYPLVDWSQRRHGHQHFFGYAGEDGVNGTFAHANGGYQCTLNNLVCKFSKPAVSMQFLFDQIKKDQSK